jgi:hypothetical protein
VIFLGGGEFSDFGDNFFWIFKCVNSRKNCEKLEILQNFQD